MPERMFFRVNSPPVVLETVDEETIIVNLDTGSYYDLNHVGGHVLHALNGGAEVEEAIAAVASRYDVEPDVLSGPARSLVSELVGEGILVSVEVPAQAPAAPPPEPAARKYEDPALAKFTDMQELLLLDPVHDVDEAGWPKQG